MQAPGPGTLRFMYGVRKRGLLDVVEQLWREYGDVFQIRIGPRTLLFAIHPDAVEHVTNSHKGNYDKRDSYDPVRKYLTGEGLVASTGDVWKRQRKLMAPFFTPKAIRTYADLMIRDGARLQERWQGLSQQGEEVEIADEMMRVTASIILGTMFSSETTESLLQLRGAIETMMRFVDWRSNLVRVPLWVPTQRNRQYLAARNRVRDTIADIIARRRAIEPAQWPDDLLSRLMTARDQETGEAMSETLLRDEAVTAFVAGHETTARTLTFAWYALGKNPHVAERLQEELDHVLGGRLPAVDDLRQLPYALRVIKEVLRLYPSAPFYARDAIAADQIAGFDVRPGTMLMLSPYYSHRHPQFWDDPERFDPDRWTREREAQSPAYHPFGAGQRICIGNNFSLLESHLLLAILAQRFSPRLRPGYQPRWEMQGVLNLAKGLPMVIVARTVR